MLRALWKIIALSCLVLTGSVALWKYQDHTAASREIARLEQKTQMLEQVVQRLGDEKRVAELLVTEQSDSSGTLQTTLLFVEYTRGGESLPPKVFTIEGKLAHVDAMVIKFDQHFVAEGDALRGHSIALFTKIYGDKQSPASAVNIDEPGKVPDIYNDADPKLAAFEQSLWNDFWRLAADEDFRKERGVRVAMGQGVWGMFEKDKLYRVTLEADGGLNLTAEPLRGIYREAMKKLH
ncbi:MAG: hypothetical protein H7Z14_07890 [Anaerolineae bacterium]|nr:hypothetical protein [Phycisphaerae bacterium]